MKNITDMTKKIWTWVKLSVFTFPLSVFVSCEQQIEDLPQETAASQFVVGDFPAYDDPQTRTIGTPEDGKTEWEEGDEILMIFDSPKYGVQSAALRYTESQWMLPEGITFKYLEGETPEIRALYSPICEVSGGMFVTADEYGTTECLWGSCNLSADGTSINISFGGRTYSRLRIATKAGSQLHVDVTKFIPAGSTEVGASSYALTTDEKGNAYLYGIFAEEATVSVKDGSIPIVDYTFSKEVHPNGTIAGKSYALDARPYLTFTADQSQTFKVSTKQSYTLDESIQYSLNSGVWTKLDVGTEITFGGDNGALRLRGKSSGGTASADYKYAFISFGDSKVKVTCSGDIRTLVDYDNYVTVSTANARFCYLFRECASLTTAPELPATTLAPYCYTAMFYHCDGLTTAPELPATTLAPYCYYAMFYHCDGLTTAPKLPATTLAEACYKQMFQSTSLTTAPKLPATTLAPYCYAAMFAYCTGLTIAPELPATTLAERCYQQMFQSTSLTTAPKLPATTLAEACYKGMFMECTGLTAAPELPATTLAPYCYTAMFYHCDGLTTAPELPATTLAEGCYQEIFRDCDGLTTAPELPATTLAPYCYNGMFFESEGLTTAPELPATVLADYCYYQMFRGCTGLTVAPKLPATTLAARCYGQMFWNCKKLDHITMLATDISADNCLIQWVGGVASTGTFTKAASLEQGTESGQIPTGVSGIPEGWTVKDYAE